LRVDGSGLRDYDLKAHTLFASQNSKLESSKEEEEKILRIEDLRPVVNFAT